MVEFYDSKKLDFQHQPVSIHPTAQEIENHQMEIPVSIYAPPKKEEPKSTVDMVNHFLKQNQFEEEQQPKANEVNY